MARAGIGLLVIALLGGSHAALPDTAPVVGYPGAAPPSRGLGSGLPSRSMSAWSRLPSEIAGGGGWSSVQDYIWLSRTLGRRAEAARVLVALGRKMPTRWLRLARADLAADTGPVRPELLPVRPRPEIRLHVDVRVASDALLEGDLQRALVPVGRVVRTLREAPPAALPLTTRLSLIRLLAAVEARRARALGWALWTEAIREGRPDIATAAQGVLGVTAGGPGVALARSALAGSQRHGGALTSFRWLAQAIDAGALASPDLAACPALSGATRAHRFDCELVAFEQAWRRGPWSVAVAAFRAMDRDLGAALPAAQRLRAGLAVLPFLEAVGEWGGFQRWYDGAARAASSLGDPGLLGDLTLALAGGLRIAGRLDEARRVLAQVSPGSSLDRRTRLHVERARLLTATGETAAGDLELVRALQWSRQASAGARIATALLALDLNPGKLGDDDVRWLEEQSPADSVAGPFWRDLIRGRVAEAAGLHGRAGRHYDAAWRRIEGGSPLAPDEAMDRLLLRRRIAERRAAVSLATARARRALEALEAGRGDARPHGGRWDHLPWHTAPGDLTLVYGRVDTDLWAWRVGDGEVEALRLTGSADEAVRLARMWASAMIRSGGVTHWARIGRRLADLLLAPVVRAGWARGKDRLLAIPAAGLEEVPLDVLAGVLPGAEMLTSGGVVTADSAGALDDSWHRSRPRGAAVVFVPRTGSASLAEARIVSAALGARAFLGRDATKASFRTATAGAAIVHFGGHSEAPSPLLDEGGLTLRPLTSASGVLGYREIAGLDLAGAMVVLLGCDTAAISPVGAQTTSIGVATSLTEAFFRAGTRAVIGNLWAIDDPAARDIAKAFYGEGGPAAGPRALAATKRRLQQLFPASPARWAGLVWQGAPPG